MNTFMIANMVGNGRGDPFIASRFSQCFAQEHFRASFHELVRVQHTTHAIKFFIRQRTEIDSHKCFSFQTLTILAKHL